MVVVVYRTGGTHNFKWAASLPIHSKRVAKQTRDNIRRMGYPAFMEPADRYALLGPPRTYGATLRSGGSNL